MVTRSHVDKTKETENWKESPMFILKARKAKKGGVCELSLRLRN